jgi:hypothetical protein
MNLFRSFLAVWTLAMAIILPCAKGETSAPLPSLQAVLPRVAETSASENSEYHVFNQHYYYLRHKVTEFYDSSGSLKERDEKQTTNNPVPAHATVTPLPAHPTRATALGKQATDQGPSVHGVNLGKKEDLLNPDLLKRYTLTITGREMINNRPTLIVDFKPASDSLPIFNIKDRFLNCVAGRAWVDEQDMVLEKVEVHLTQKISILGGLVGSVSKFTFSFDRERTPDGLWFTSDMAWHLEAHEATIARVVDHHEYVTDLQKMSEAR